MIIFEQPLHVVSAAHIFAFLRSKRFQIKFSCKLNERSITPLFHNRLLSG